MSFSKHVWNKTASIYQAIIDHPFNQKLMQGTLEKDKFVYYIEQDSLYLQDFSRCLALIASRVPVGYIRPFLGYADYALIAEQEIVHQFFKGVFESQETGILTPSTVAYTGYLLRICAMEPYEVAIAAVLPCFWIYREVGFYISQNSVPTNPYARWIETYSGEDFSKSVDGAIRIFDEVASSAHEIIRQKMLEAFYKSSIFEWHFWNDAYEKRRFDSVGVDMTIRRKLSAFG